MPNSSSPPPISNTSIDHLPDPLLTHILSFLYIKDAIQTSLLSRKFRNLWHSIPSLNFDMLEYYSRSTSPYPRTHVARQNFAGFVYHTLFVRKPFPLTKFALTFENIAFQDEAIPRYEHYVQNWVRYAIGLSVSELVLDFDDDKFSKWPWRSNDESDSEEYESWYFDEFHFCFLDIRESRIEVLKLFKCRLILPQNSNPVKFVYLKWLEFGCDVTLGREVVCDILERCVNLETLKIIDVDIDSYQMTIHSASLKELSLNRAGAGHFDICCPNLQKISLICSNAKYTIKHTTMLVEACLDFFQYYEKDTNWEKMLSCFTNVTSLHVWDELLESNGVPAGCEQFASNVKHLELYCAYNENDLVGLTALLKLLPNLEVLLLHNRKIKTRLIDRDTKKVKFHKDYYQTSTVLKMPCLRKVILRNYQKSIGEQHFIKLFRKNGAVLEKIKLLPY